MSDPLPRPHYFYFDSKQCCFVEYGGIEITEAQFKKLKNADAVLKTVQNEGGKIKNILYRENGIINLNYITDASDPYGCGSISVMISENALYDAGDTTLDYTLQEVYTPQGGEYYPSIVEYKIHESETTDGEADYFCITEVSYPDTFPY